MVGASRGRCGALAERPPLVDGVHLGREELQPPLQVPLLTEEVLLVREDLPVLVLKRLSIQKGELHVAAPSAVISLC